METAQWKEHGRVSTRVAANNLPQKVILKYKYTNEKLD